MDTAQLLTTHEECTRKAFWLQRWEKNKMPVSAILDDGIKVGLQYNGHDFGEEAGSRVFELAATRGLDSDQYDQHSEATHVAAMADIICTAVRKSNDKPWKMPDAVDGWTPSCFVSPDGNYLRRIVTVSNWSEARQHSITRSWATLGPVAFYDLPMQIVVVITGNRRDGRYHSFWSHALQHPQNKKLRFRKKHDLAAGFKSSWLECWRPDHDEITTKQWLDAMIEDDVLRDLCFKLDVVRMEEITRSRIIGLAKRKLDQIMQTERLPDEQYAHCCWPVHCPYLGCCNRGELPNGRFGFVPIQNIPTF